MPRRMRALPILNLQRRVSRRFGEPAGQRPQSSRMRPKYILSFAQRMDRQRDSGTGTKYRITQRPRPALHAERTRHSAIAFQGRQAAEELDTPALRRMLSTLPFVNWIISEPGNLRYEVHRGLRAFHPDFDAPAAAVTCCSVRVHSALRQSQDGRHRNLFIQFAWIYRDFLIAMGG